MDLDLNNTIIITPDNTIYGLRFAQLLIDEDENGNTENTMNIVYDRTYNDEINDEGINEAYIIYKSINYIDCYRFFYYAKCNSNIVNKYSNNSNVDSYYMEWLPITKEKLIEIFLKNLKLH
jgi:hypothetical protein